MMDAGERSFLLSSLDLLRVSSSIISSLKDGVNLPESLRRSFWHFRRSLCLCSRISLMITSLTNMQKMRIRGVLSLLFLSL